MPAARDLNRQATIEFNVRADFGGVKSDLCQPVFAYRKGF